MPNFSGANSRRGASRAEKPSSLAPGDCSVPAYESPRSLPPRQLLRCVDIWVLQTYLSVSFLDPVFFRFGVGILHSIENAVQFVHGTPRLAASHRT